MATRYDAIVIGTGQSGPPLASRLADEGTEDRRHRAQAVRRHLRQCRLRADQDAGGERARRLHRAPGRRFRRRINGAVKRRHAKVKARKDAIVDSGTRGIAKWMRSTDNVTVYKGHARFEGPKTVRVNGELLEAERIFINVGGRALVPDMPGIKDVPYLTNSTMLDLDVLPEHLVVIGGSYIGLEFAQMYRRFGSRVTVIEMGDRLIGREDADVSDAVREILEGEGIEVRLKAECISAKMRGKKIAVGLDCADASKQVGGLASAAGGRPRAQHATTSGSTRPASKTDARGFITVDDELKTNVPGIWAIGDCNGRGAFTHTSYNDYEIVAANLFDGGKRKVSDRIPTYALFIDPPLGRAGMSEREARATGKRLLVGKLDMSSVGRARERSETLGFMKMVVDADSERILGAAMLGIEGDEVVQSILDLMYAGVSYKQIERIMYIHPTVMEYLPTLVGNLEPV